MKMLARSLCFAIVLILVGLLTMRGALNAQTCTYCNYFLGTHDFSSLTCDEEDPGCWGCDDTPEGHIGCHSFSYQGECGEGHSRCGATLLDEQLVLAVVDAGDAALLTSLLTRNPDRMSFNEIRRSIQLRNCKGAVVTNVPLKSAELLDVIKNTVVLPVHSASESYRSLPSLRDLNGEESIRERAGAGAIKE